MSLQELGVSLQGLGSFTGDSGDESKMA